MRCPPTPTREGPRSSGPSGRRGPAARRVWALALCERDDGDRVEMPIVISHLRSRSAAGTRSDRLLARRVGSSCECTSQGNYLRWHRIVPRRDLRPKRLEALARPGVGGLGEGHARLGIKNPFRVRARRSVQFGWLHLAWIARNRASMGRTSCVLPRSRGIESHGNGTETVMASATRESRSGQRICAGRHRSSVPTMRMGDSSGVWIGEPNSTTVAARTRRRAPSTRLSRQGWTRWIGTGSRPHSSD